MVERVDGQLDRSLRSSGQCMSLAGTDDVSTPIHRNSAKVSALQAPSYLDIKRCLS